MLSSIDREFLLTLDPSDAVALSRETNHSNASDILIKGNRHTGVGIAPFSVVSSVAG